MDVDKHIIGKKIVEVRDCTTEEAFKEGWDDENFSVIVLENGLKIYPSRDYEGNGPGVLFVENKGKTFGIG